MKFTLGVPAIGENFVDRAEQLELILSVTEAAIHGKAQNSVAFIGAAGIGKTSLLLEGARRIKAQYPEQTGVIVIFGREISNEMHFLETVREGLGIPQKRFVLWQDLGEYLFEHIANRPDQLVILMVDDFDELAYKRDTFIYFLREQYQSLKNLLLFITLSSRERQVEKIFGEKAAFHGQLLIKKIDALPPEAANQLMDGLSSGRFSDSVKAEILALSEREPLFIQLLCKGAERAADVKSLLSETLVFSSPFFKEVWKKLSSQQRAILREMAGYEAAVSPTEIAKEISVEPKNISIQFQRLMDLKIVKKTDDGYRLKPLLKEWLKKGGDPMCSENSNGTMNIAQVAQLLEVSEGVVQRLNQSGRLHGLESEGTLQFEAAEVQALNQWWQKQLDMKFNAPAVLSYLQAQYEETCKKRDEIPTDEGFAAYVNQERQRTHKDCIGAILWSDERTYLFDRLEQEQDGNVKEELANEILGDRTIVDWIDKASEKYWKRNNWHTTVCEPEDVQERTFAKLQRTWYEGQYQYLGELELKGFIYQTASFAARELYREWVLSHVLNLGRLIGGVHDNAQRLATLHGWYCDFLKDNGDLSTLTGRTEYRKKAEELFRRWQAHPEIMSQLRQAYDEFRQSQTAYSTSFDNHLKGFAYFVVDYLFRKAWVIFNSQTGPVPPSPPKPPLGRQAAVIVKACLSQNNIFRTYAFFQVSVDRRDPGQVAEQLLTFREGCLQSAEAAGGGAVADRIMGVIRTHRDEPPLYDQYPLTVVLRTISQARRPPSPEDHAILRPLVAQATSSIHGCVAERIDTRWTDEEQCIKDWLDMYNALVVFEYAALETLFVELADEPERAKDLLWRIHAILANSSYDDHQDFSDTARKQLQLRGEFRIMKDGNIEWFVQGTVEMDEHPHRVLVQAIRKQITNRERSETQ